MPLFGVCEKTTPNCFYGIIDMMHCYDIRIDGKYEGKICAFMENVRKEFNDFFRTEINDPNVFFLNSRKSINEVWGRKTERWLTAWADNSNIFILNPEVYTKESDHRDVEHFWKALKHEYCHLYFEKVTGGGYPKWLNEGLSCYLADQVKGKPAKEEALQVFKCYKEINPLTYKVGYFWVNFLINNFGKGKMLKLIRNLYEKDTEKQFNAVFKDIYGFNFSKTSFVKILDRYANLL